MREMKDDGDTLLRLTLASQQETGGVNARPARRREADGSYEGEQSSTVGSTAEQDPKMHSILQRSIHNYIDCLTLLVSPPPAGCKTPESIMISEGKLFILPTTAVNARGSEIQACAMQSGILILLFPQET